MTTVDDLHAQQAPDADDEFSCVEAREALEKIQALLWFDTDYIGDYWNADKEWDSSLLEDIASVVYALRPKLGDSDVSA